MANKKRQIIEYTTESEWLRHRKRDITSTEISCLFDCCPYKTEYELWNEKIGGIEPEPLEPNERMRWGNLLESVISQEAAMRAGLRAMPYKKYIRLADERLGSSFDWIGFAPDIGGGDGFRLLECKNVDWLRFRDTWLDAGGEIEAPPHIELQIQHQMLVSGHNHGYIAVLVGGNEMHIMERRADAGIHGEIIRRAAEFWESTEPRIDFTRDCKAVDRMTRDMVEPGKFMDVKAREQFNRLALAYDAGRESVKTGKQAQDTAKCELLTLIGDAEVVVGDGWTLKRGKQFNLKFKAEKSAETSE